MIRGWVDSHFEALRNRLTKSASKSGLVSEVENYWMEGLYVLGIILMTAGLVCAVLEPVNFGYTIFPSSGAQSATETGIDALAVLLGAAGVYLSYVSGRQTTKSRVVNFYLTIGLLMIAISVFIGIYVLQSK